MHGHCRRQHPHPGGDVPSIQVCCNKNCKGGNRLNQCGVMESSSWLTNCRKHLVTTYKTQPSFTSGLAAGRTETSEWIGINRWANSATVTLCHTRASVSKWKHKPLMDVAVGDASCSRKQTWTMGGMEDIESTTGKWIDGPSSRWWTEHWSRIAEVLPKRMKDWWPIIFHECETSRQRTTECPPWQGPDTPTSESGRDYCGCKTRKFEQQIQMQRSNSLPYEDCVCSVVDVADLIPLLPFILDVSKRTREQEEGEEMREWKKLRCKQHEMAKTVSRFDACCTLAAPV